VAQPTQPEIATATQTALTQWQPTSPGQHLAVRPRLDLRSALDATRQRQQAQAGLGLGERRLGLEGQRVALEGRRTDLAIDQADYNASMVPYQIGLGAVGGGLGLYRGYRDLQQGKLQEDMLRQNMAIQAETGRLRTLYAGQRVTSLAEIADLLRRQGTPPDTITSTNLMP
jgi:hypothetical protein